MICASSFGGREWAQGLLASLSGGSSNCQTSCHLLWLYTQGQGQTEAFLQVEPGRPHSLLE